jgi:putative transposase
MPRASRHYIPGYIWHITHRCHKKEFLLKFARDRRRWVAWVFEARKRYGLSILNYMVTSNHIHLLVCDDGDRDTIPKSIQLVAARTGQEYNQRKKRKGAFWEDRYHATAVERDHHLAKCMVYIDMNMVRAGVVKHPKQWPFCGYNEILSPPKRYRIIDFRKLLELLQVGDIADLQRSCRARVEEVLASANCRRESKWTESIAVGSEQFVDITKQQLGSKANGRQVIGDGETYELREEAAPYRTHFDSKNSVLRPENMYFWNAIA